MKPVFQKTVDGETGDCFSAALASLLEVSLEEVPRFAELHGVTTMMKPAREWLAEHHGLSIVTIQMAEEIETGKDIRIIGAVPGTPCIAGGRSPNFEGRQHAVVGEIDEHGMNFRMTHDPNPSGKGIVGLPIHLYFLVPLSYTVTSRAIDWLGVEIDRLLNYYFIEGTGDTAAAGILGDIFRRLPSSDQEINTPPCPYLERRENSVSCSLAEVGINVWRRKADEFEQKAKDWQHEFNMYRSAWIRELKGPYRNKTHEIDALILTTRDLREERDRLRTAIIKHRAQKADDRCIEDDDKLYAAVGDGIKCDRRVGDKIAMLHNCARFIENRCEGGGWKSYVELEAERDRYKLLAFEAVGLLSHGRPIHPGEPAIALQVSKRTVDKFVTTLRELVAPGVEKENKKE